MCPFHHPCIQQKFGPPFPPKDALGHVSRQTITGSFYLDILCGFVTVQNALEDRANSMRFMQDGARPHRTAEVFPFLNKHFDYHVIALDYCKHTESCMF